MTRILARIAAALRGSGAPVDTSARRAGVDPLPAVVVSPRVWVALG